jgi:hypothetical protein
MKKINELASGAPEVDAKLGTWASADSVSNECSSSVCGCYERHGDGLKPKTGFSRREVRLYLCRVLVYKFLPSMHGRYSAITSL